MIVGTIGNPFEWNTPDEIRTQLTYKCSVCYETLIREYLGLTPDIPKHPGSGWRFVGEAWVCPKHTVMVTIDDRSTEYK